MATPLLATYQALRGHFQVLATHAALSAEDRLRLCAALLTDGLTAARLAGQGPARLDSIVREGEELALEAPLELGTEPTASLSAWLGFRANVGDLEQRSPESETPAAGIAEPARDTDVLDAALFAPKTQGSPAGGPDQVAPYPPGDSEDRGSPNQLAEDAREDDDAPSVSLAESSSADDPLDTAFEDLTADPFVGDLILDEVFSGLIDAHDDSQPAPRDENVALDEDPTLGGDALPKTSEIDLRSVLREHPRFESREKVVIQLAGRAEFKDLYARDISKGGLFVAAADPPPIGARMKIRFETPDGMLELNGSVVHVLDAAAAEKACTEPGVGIQFDDLDRRTSATLSAYVNGVTEKLSLIERRDASGPARAARTLMQYIEKGELYDALDISPSADRDAVAKRLDEIREQFSAVLSDASGAEAVRLKNALRMLQRLAHVLSDETRRLAYDFSHGHVRADERIARCNGDAKAMARLRGVWKKVHPDKAQQAADLVREAMRAEAARDFDQAERSATEALTLDPFYMNLRKKLAQVSQLKCLVEDMRLQTYQADEWPDVVEKLGIDPEFARKLWTKEHPDKMREAMDLGRKALQAETIKRFAVAVENGRKALERDPFNIALRDTIEKWQAAA